MTTFAGFPTGKNNPYIPVPEVFFTHVLPHIEDSVELKVTLHLFWLLAKKQSQPRCISDQELQHDQILLTSLKRRGDPRPPEERVLQGLEMAVVRGTLLRVNLQLLQSIEDSTTPQISHWYFFNTQHNQKLIAQLEGGELIPARLLLNQSELVSTAPLPVRQESRTSIGTAVYANSRYAEAGRTSMHVEVSQPNIFVLYEQNIGLLTPMIAEEIKDALNHYPTEWIEEAIREAMLNNKRKWNYIRAILRRWETEGR